MTPLITDQIRDALDAEQGEPVKVLDEVTNRTYVIISIEQFDKLRSVLEAEPLTLEQQHIALIDAGKRAGWDDPEMDAYDDYDANRLPQ